MTIIIHVPNGRDRPNRRIVEGVVPLDRKLTTQDMNGGILISHFGRKSSATPEAATSKGPGYDEVPGYYTVFFEDPRVTVSKICHDEPNERKII